MKYKSLVLGAAGAAILFGAATVAARSYNPMKWIKKLTASQGACGEQPREEKALTLQLQALLLPARTTLKDACTLFKTLDDCVAAHSRQQQSADQIQLPEMGYDRGTPQR